MTSCDVLKRLPTAFVKNVDHEVRFQVFLTVEKRFLLFQSETAKRAKLQILIRGKLSVKLNQT